MKKLLFIGTLLCFSLSLFSQALSIVSPDGWYRVDSVQPTDIMWRDMSGHFRHAIPQQEHFPDEALYNYNRCFTFTGQEEPFKISSLMLTNSELTVMIAYQTQDTLTERGLWSVEIDSSRNGLTTRHILGEQMSITYSDTNHLVPIVNTLKQNWKRQDTLFNEHLLIGKVDSMTFSGKLGEVVFFNKAILGKELLQWQSYLAVKYGITLTNRDYISSVGDTVWHYDLHPDFAASIAGIGRDDHFGLYQKQSRMDHLLSIGFGAIAVDNHHNLSTVPQGNFLIWGSSSPSLTSSTEVYLQSGEAMTVYGNCLMEASGAEIRQAGTSVQIDASKWENADPQRCVLLIDRNQTGDFSGNTVDIYYPTDIDTFGVVTFSDILWDSDCSGSDLFCFGFYSSIDTSLIGNPKGAHSDHHNGDQQQESVRKENDYTLYPNPTSGDYNLLIHLSEISDVTIRILTLEGKILEIQTLKGQKDYHFSGSLNVKGYYLIEVESALERKSFKIVNN